MAFLKDATGSLLPPDILSTHLNIKQSTIAGLIGRVEDMERRLGELETGLQLSVTHAENLAQRLTKALETAAQAEANAKAASMRTAEQSSATATADRALKSANQAQQATGAIEGRVDSKLDAVALRLSTIESALGTAVVRVAEVEAARHSVDPDEVVESLRAMINTEILNLRSAMDLVERRAANEVVDQRQRLGGIKPVSHTAPPTWDPSLPSPSNTKGSQRSPRRTWPRITAPPLPPRCPPAPATPAPGTRGHSDDYSSHDGGLSDLLAIRKRKRQETRGP